MKPLKRMWPVAITLAFALFALAQVGTGDEVTPDVPEPIATDLFHPPIRLAAADGIIDSGPAWGHSGPWVEDVDGDGVKDLVVGDFSGLFRFYRNAGSSRQPRYENSVNLQAGGADAKVPIY